MDLRRLLPPKHSPFKVQVILLTLLSSPQIVHYWVDFHRLIRTLMKASRLLVIEANQHNALIAMILDP